MNPDNGFGDAGPARDWRNRDGRPPDGNRQNRGNGRRAWRNEGNQPRGQDQGQVYRRREDGRVMNQNIQNEDIHQDENTRRNNRPFNRNNRQGLRQQNRQNDEENENDNTGRNDRQQNRNNYNNRNDNQQQRNRFMGFRTLEEISQADSKEIILKINEKKESFINLLESSIDKFDIIVLIMKVISKVCQSTFDQLKLKLLLEICNSRFLGSLRNYLLELPYAKSKAKNHHYWDNQQEFWENFVNFCECIIDISPATALHKCRSLMEGASKCCLEGLQERHGFTLSEECSSKMAQLRERLIICEKKDETEKQKPMKIDMGAEDGEPPDDFRALSVVPSSADMFDKRPFLRPNIVQGGYRDVEHYLDVQFRLLREDCFGPLREGIHQFVENPNRKKFDHIRVMRDVKFVEPYISKTKIGATIKFDDKTNKRLKRINWAHSKRFIFGSLLLLTKDNCKNFIVATVLDRDIKLLAQGKVPLSIISTVVDNIYNDDSYILIESEVYYEPYLHVLKALQDPKFPEHIAMKKYIVHVDPEPKPPLYLQPDTVFAVQTQYSARTKFRVLNELTWPSQEELGLNTSQYEAYKLSLTHEFVVIQGPPGTGKTFLGVKIAKTLLKNRTTVNGACLMLVICYTNHALDQFLEAILPVTKSIARIGGQSRNEAMEKINLTTLRKKSDFNYQRNRGFFELRNNLRRAVAELQQAQERLDDLNNGVISYRDLQSYARESQFVGQFYANSRQNVKTDPLKHWLFENMQYLDIQNIMAEANEEQNADAVDEVDENINEEIEIILDDFEAMDGEEVNVFLEDTTINTSFSVKDTQSKLRTLISLHKKTDNRRKQQELQREILDLTSRIALFNEMASNRTRETRFHLNERTDLARIPTIERWSLYFRWSQAAINTLKRRIKPLEEQLQDANNAYEESRMMTDLQILKGVKVIGMTTSGAARLRKLLQALAPPIVIVEEAAEVLEQHIVTSLTKHCEHLILIGDHQQLRPSAAHMRLARYFNIEISLFERMIKNGLHSRRLGVQHRMRPEIATLISPHIYEDLENHPSVEHFPRVLGMADNLFFLTHNYKEEEVDDSSSRSNHQEADMALRLANYLMQQGYQPGDVTVLAAYSGQMFYMRKQRDKYDQLSKVKITVVDNYQGEESKIIILSLVRNNDENKIGFLGTENRICVALSRAREGFYILGNIDILKRNSELWKKIALTLETNASLGSTLMLKCETHPSQITTISSPKDFEKVPEGGCLLKCNFNLPCGHLCPRVCHGYDRSHVETKCFMKCERVLCELGHVCPLICSLKCRPCERLVEKTLPCGHKMKVYCHQEPTDPAIKCLTTVTVTLPRCKHEAKKSCYLDTALVKCPVPCIYRVKCGHQCRRKCHVNDDPDHELYNCEKPCQKAKKGCTANLEEDRGDHQCFKRCFEDCDYCTVEVRKKRTTCKHWEDRVPCNIDVSEIPCRKKCARTLQCGHFCKKKCCEKCGDCNEKVKKIIPDCQHEITLICKQEATRELCRRKCERMLPCGHICPGLCKERCDPTRCVEIISKTFASPCGHQVMMPCNAYRLHAMGSGTFDATVLLQHCSKPCGKELACGHFCGGTCSQCHQGRLHIACTQPCQQTNICGHRCQESCNQVCPPCKMPCEIKCPHSQCKKPCGAPCMPCAERCHRTCPHGSCTRLCGQPCSRPPCDEPCQEELACGHRCRGLCGEPCPDICTICRPDDLPMEFIKGEFEDNDKCVQLQDCPHAMEVENLDNLMTGDQTSVAIRTCPMCRKPIINTYRYKDFVNNMIKTEINPIKEKVYGNEALIKKKREELFLDVIAFNEKHELILEENSDMRKAYNKLYLDTMTQKKVSLLKLDMRSQYLNILDMIRECYQKYKAANLKELHEELLNLIKIICSALTSDKQKISEQLQMDIAKEINRMNSIIQLSQILSHPSYLSSKHESNIVNATKAAKQVVLSKNIFEENKATVALKALQDAVKVFGIVTKQERDLIVKAIGSKAGSWYKCPNGHFYSISHCGGAMQISKCADCGAPIGGEHHRLLTTNEHAGELDGSSAAAWSNVYNEMANFDLH